MDIDPDWFAPLGLANDDHIYTVGVDGPEPLLPPALDTRDLMGTIAQGMKDGHAKAAEAARKAEAEQVVAKAVERTIAFR